MKKLRLDLDTLAVQSFQTLGTLPAVKGTVRGAEFSLDPYCADPNGGGGGSLIYTCKQTCDTCDPAGP